MCVGLFKKRSADRKARSVDHAAIIEFIDSRRGVEAFLEPQTSVTKTTVVFVAGDGESLRKPFDTPKAAAEFARKHRIPLYDTNKVGYPQRMRDYNTRTAASAKKTKPAAAPNQSTTATPARWTPGHSIQLRPESSRSRGCGRLCCESIRCRLPQLSPCATLALQARILTVGTNFAPTPTWRRYRDGINSGFRRLDTLRRL